MLGEQAWAAGDCSFYSTPSSHGVPCPDQSHVLVHGCWALRANPSPRLDGEAEEKAGPWHWVGRDLGEEGNVPSRSLDY